MRLPRLAARCLMVLAAATVMGAAIHLVNLAAVYRLKAEEHRASLAPINDVVRAAANLHVGPDGRLAAYHAALRLKYEYAARHPWLPVPPDPPPPK